MKKINKTTLKELQDQINLLNSKSLENKNIGNKIMSKNAHSQLKDRIDINSTVKIHPVKGGVGFVLYILAFIIWLIDKVPFLKKFIFIINIINIILYLNKESIVNKLSKFNNRFIKIYINLQITLIKFSLIIFLFL